MNLNFDYIRRETCRLCGSPFFSEKLALKPTGLANELFEDKNKALEADLFPLTLVMCSKCRHVQLQDIVKPQRLFDSYLYKTGLSRTFVKHFDQLAELIKTYVPKYGLVLEVGSNDGTLLEALSKLNIQAVGLEPAENLNVEVRKKGLSVITGYLEESLENSELLSRAPYDLIVGNNVFAHIDDISLAIQVCVSLLKNQGKFVFEVAHLLSLVEHNLFDTIYHEHMSYHSILALEPFLNENNLEIIKVDLISTHGGSLRVVAQKTEKPKKLESVHTQEILLREQKANLDNPAIFFKLQEAITKQSKEVQTYLRENTTNKRIIGYGAPAKIVTYLTQLGLNEFQFEFIIDDNELKQNKYLPQTGIKIVNRNNLNSISDPESIVFVIFAWNLREDICNRLKEKNLENSTVISFLPSLMKETIN